MKTTTMLLVATFAALGAVACGPDYDRTEMTGVVTGPLGGEINYQHVTVPEGALIKVHIVSLNSDNKPMTNQFTSDNPGVVEFSQVVSDRDYAFLGVAVGTTKVTIKAEDKVVLVLDATVTPQPPLP